MRPRDVLDNTEQIAVPLTPTEILTLIESDWTEDNDADAAEWEAFAAAEGKMRKALREAGIPV